MAAWTGAPVAGVMARLGHSTPRAALRYQHATAERGAEIAAKLDAFAAPRGLTPPPVTTPSRHMR
jgi:hypothetical protein